MGWKRDESNRSMTILTAGLLLVGIFSFFAYIYYSSSSDFIINVYPNTEIHACMIDGSLTFDQWTETASGGYKLDLPILTTTVSANGDYKMEFKEKISVTDMEGPWWALGHVIKPYREEVTLFTQYSPPGVDITYSNTPFSAEIQDTSKIKGIPPFNSTIILKFVPNSTLDYGNHYIIIKGIGQDEKASTCTCVLKVGNSCGPLRFSTILPRGFKVPPEGSPV
jgi:hypothetical protein